MAETRTPQPGMIDPGYYLRLFEGAGLAIVTCTPTGKVIAWNRLAEELFSAQPEFKAGDPISELLTSIEPDVLRESWDGCVRTREPVELRANVQRADRSIGQFAVWLAPTLNLHDEVDGVSVWFQDITSRLRMRQDQRTRERLTTLGALSGAIAHHYNNMLCSIATSLEYALNMNTMTAMRRALQRTADAVSRASGLTQQLLAFAQADHRATDLADFTETVLYFFDEAEDRLAKHRIQLELNWRPSFVLPIPRDALTVVLANIVNNAIEAMPAGGTLTVRLGADNTDMVLSIADTGGGIAADHIDRVFEPFFTTKGELASGATRQAGMGLAVAHGLVHEMHGRISAINSPDGKGAIFEIRLPLHED